MVCFQVQHDIEASKYLHSYFPLASVSAMPQSLYIWKSPDISTVLLRITFKSPVIPTENSIEPRENFQFQLEPEFLAKLIAYSPKLTRTFVCVSQQPCRNVCLENPPHGVPSLYYKHQEGNYNQTHMYTYIWIGCVNHKVEKSSIDDSQVTLGRSLTSSCQSSQ